ncbi:MAG: InlB B-repeat-containing protein [Eubacteriales bacterium]|nr:InlB B-repeat-containing protein [Eubacteriales bacterium]
MRKKLSLKIIVLLFAVLLLVPVFSVNLWNLAVNAAGLPGGSGLTIYCGNDPVSSLLLETDERMTLTAEGLSGNAAYSWQILKMDTGEWVDIYDATDTACGLSYALVKNIIGSGVKTAIRCSARQNDTLYYSDPVFVTVDLSSGQETQEAVTVVPVSEQTVVQSAAQRKRAAAAASAESDTDTVTITIHYQLEDGTTIFQDYVASLLDGSSFSASVLSPLYIGYTPFIEEDGGYTDASTVALQYTNLHTDVELTVVYKPAESPYTVHYFLQNVLNDLYTEDASLKFRGSALTGSYPSEKIEIEIPGFTALFHLPDVVAADGSTEFECYYDRNYYLYNFDCNGGYGVEPVYARYGASLIIGEPTRTGYTFAGWDLMAEDGSYDGIADEPDATVGIGNKTYRALWTAGTASFTVVYWGENADDDGFSYISSHTYETTSGLRIRSTDFSSFEFSSKEGDTYPGGTPRPYYAEADYFVYDSERTERNNAFLDETDANGNPMKCLYIEGDGSTTLNVVYKRKEYTLKFFYAKSQVEDGENQYYVVGGSTYYFGWADTADEQTMLEAENSVSGVWGQVESQPTLNDRGKARGYTLGSETYNGVTYYYLSFDAKYGSDISGLWPVSVFEPVKRTEANTHGNWSGMEAYRSAWNGEPYVKYTQDNLNGNQTIKGIYQKLDSQILYDLNKHADSDTVRYLCFWENGADISWSVPKLFIYELYVPAAEGEEGSYFYDGVAYKLYVAPFNTYDDSDVNNQTASALEGFTFLTRDSSQNPDLENGMKSHTVRFFYTRNSHTLTFSSQNDSVFSATTPYEYELRNYAGETAVANPPYPSSLEPGAYEFDGWYLAPEGQGTRIDMENTQMTMPDSELTLYAYWRPVEHTVTFSDTYQKMLDGEYKETVTVAHGDFIAAADVPDPDSSALGAGSYDFKGWFYINGKGEKQAFSASEMMVNADMHLFAEWQSASVVPYTIYYCDENGNKVAEDTVGYSYAGATKTFVAKAGEELNEGYRSHYYPATNSHSVLMSMEEANQYTFRYVYKAEVGYTVRYVAQDTGEELIPAKTDITDKSVLTEKFEYISGYIPDAFYKRLVLAADEEENIITFYYTRDAGHAIYAIRHMVEELDGSYSEYAYIEGVGDLDQEVFVPPMIIDGFTYDTDVTGKKNAGDITVSESGVSGIVTQDGLEMELYYRRDLLSYTIQYVEYGTSNVLEEPVVEEKAKFGETITHEPVPELTIGEGTEDSATYQLIDPQNTPRTFTLREDHQIFTVYYRIQQHTINYIAVSNYPGAVDFGSVSPLSEMVSRVSGVAGSTPEAAEGYRFEGWYTDAACTVPVDPDWIDDNKKLTPEDLSLEVSNYYALFVPQIGNLTIYKEGAADADQNQTFLFSVIGAGRGLASGINLTVSITGNGSVTVTDLPVGRYAVAEITDWSWRYLCDGADSQSVIVTEDGANSVTFKNIGKNTTWLGGEASKDNRFRAAAAP